mgnify:CR=1 FL=1
MTTWGDDVSTTVSESSRHGIPEETLERIRKASDMPAVVGKYVELPDSYLSVREALIHAGVPLGVEVDVRWVQSGGLEQRDLEQELADADGIVIPGGFGERGAEGEVAAARFARETELPYLGLCRGMQQMVIEFARDVLGWDDATSTEFDPESRHPVISLLEEQKGIENLGGTMRLGHYPCMLREGSKAHAAFGRDHPDLEVPAAV